MTDEVLAGQVDYYRRRAGEHDVTAYGVRRWGRIVRTGRYLHIKGVLAGSVMPGKTTTPGVVCITRTKYPA